MQIHETKNFLSIILPDKVLIFGNTEYSGKLKCFKPLKNGAYLNQFETFFNKKEAVKFVTTQLHWPASSVDRIGNVFGKAWGVRHDIRDNFFLLK